MPARSNKNYTALTLDDIKVVKRGHLNYLLNKKKVFLNTIDNHKIYEKNKIIREKREAREKEEMQNMAQKLQDSVIKCYGEVQDKKLFSAVTNRTISQLIEEQKQCKVHFKKIDLIEDIKKLGEYRIRINFNAEIVTHIQLVIMKKEKTSSES